MNIGAKILKKILVKQTQQHIKRITHQEQLIFVLDTTFGSAFLPLIIQDLFFLFVCLFVPVTHFIMVDIS